MRTKDDTLYTSLIDCAHTIASTQGVDAINIRNLANNAHVSVGTIYNYFKNKDELLIALTQSYWQDVYRTIKTQCYGYPLVEALPLLYRIIKISLDASLGSLLNCLSSIEVFNNQQLALMQQDLKQFVIYLINADDSIDNHLFNDDLSKEQFAQFIVDYFFIYLRKQDTSLDAFIHIIERIIYPDNT